MVGDRGMLTQKQVDALRDIDGVDWIGALRPEAIKKLATNGAIQMGLFDERNLFELKYPDFPGERLVVCLNADLAHRRAIERENLLKATVKELDKVRGMVRRGRLSGKKEIDARVRGILKKYRIGKHFDLDIREDRVRAHIFLCMLAYYVQWHMMEAWRPLLYADEDQKAKDLRDPVAPAKRSDSAMKKVRALDLFFYLAVAG